MALRGCWAVRGAAVGALAGAALLTAGTARAQQNTFHLDRLEVPGSPDDGLVLFRPATQERAIVYAQLGLGLSINPLRMSDIIQTDPATLRASQANAITNQFSTYMSAGFELLDHLTLGVTMPIAWEESGNLQSFNSSFNPHAYTNYQTTGPAVGDLRLDARYVLLRSEDRRWALGGQLSVFAPTGNGSTTNFGGDGSVGWMPMVTAEYTPVHFLTLVANTGVDFRPDNSINDPAARSGSSKNGLGIGDEWRWAVGALLPLAGGKYRLGATIFGQTGINSDQTIGTTAFTRQNSPIEYDFEGRMRLPMAGWEHWYVGLGAGSLLAPGYGAPDFRAVALFGTYFVIEDTNPQSPDARAKTKPR